METTLRARLKAETRTLHDRLDRLVSRHDLTTEDGLAGFLTLQIVGFEPLAGTGGLGPTASAIADATARARQDLATLNRAQPERSAAAAANPMAVTYLFTGSRLGSEVLKRRWQAATSPAVRRADAYFSAPSHVDLWQRFCRESAALSADEPAAIAVVTDTLRLYERFLAVALAPVGKIEATNA